LLTLLSAKCTNGVPGFFVALQNGRADAIRAYGELLKEAMAARGLSRERLLTLLSAKHVNGTPGFLMTWGNGHVDAIFVYYQVVRAVAHQLNQGQRKRLLAVLITSYLHASSFYIQHDDVHNKLKQKKHKLYRQFNATKKVLNGSLINS
jgi:hypothetical protein